MDSEELNNEREEYRLVFLRPGFHSTVGESGPRGFRLPRVSIPRWSRPAREIQRAITSRFGLCTLVIDISSDSTKSSHFAVVEILSGEVPKTFGSVGFDDFEERELAEEERRLTHSILEGDARGPFSSIGWLEQARKWIRCEAGNRTKLCGDILQYNAGGKFALVYFPAEEGRGFWLKATGEPNQSEFGITTWLARNLPAYLPRLICSRADWNAWVTADAGRPLDVHVTRDALEESVVSLADLQIKSIGRDRELLEAGCVNQTVIALQASIDELVSFLQEAMSQQTSLKVAQVPHWRLAEIGQIAKDACDRIMNLSLPHTLIHNDLNLGNILSDGVGCVFTDWAEGYVGIPFTSFCLFERDVQHNTKTSGWTWGLATLYERRWREVLAPRQVRFGLAVAPLLAMVSSLYGRGSWLNTPRRKDARFLVYARSLARHMDRAAQNAGLQEALRA